MNFCTAGMNSNVEGERSSCLTLWIDTHRVGKLFCFSFGILYHAVK